MEKKITTVGEAIKQATDKSANDPDTVYYVVECHKSKGFYVCTDGMIRNFETLIGTAFAGQWEKSE